jgi:hypothetical protein
MSETNLNRLLPCDIPRTASILRIASARFIDPQPTGLIPSLIGEL